MGISTSTTTSTFTTPNLEKMKSFGIEIKAKDETSVNYDKCTFDDLGRIKSYRDGDTYITYTYEYNNERIKKVFQVPDMCQINVMVEIKVGEHFIKIFGTDEIDIEKLVQISNTFSRYYNEQILEYIDKYFTGIIIGDMTAPSDLRYQGRVGHSYEAYSNTNPPTFHVFTDGTNFEPNIILHEMGHFVMSALYAEGKWDASKVQELCDKYESWLAKNETSSYKVETHNPSEFFADASSNFFLEPEKMQYEAPELYDFLNGIYGGK